ncbi:hypothetical protein HMPREF1991_02856 [Hoylesella loescheii DSM 19665 = JCM 12249 = ATCC 15930]|uniref:Uncharacterized protein n=1 Tax=Hoylesella loescheii DSM 19665 = JCM 12249 = ATCC 15930 TaxID=1122985 RepID=A0A069QGC2_HOYLO|nr:hypothetical protein HMPREF1991_02856 [Hoylesella loescheii DSM 19665 = JCM 12249 = ATCC 15930]
MHIILQGRRSWSFYVRAICLGKPMAKDNIIRQWHLPAYLPIE